MPGLVQDEPGHDEARVLDLPHGWKPEIHTRRTPETR
jgi:hypothetical protein